MNLNGLLGRSDPESSVLKELSLPVASLYIYCAPCACLLTTALSICTDAGARAKMFFELLVRPDDRLVSSCCYQEDRSFGLASLMTKVREIESLPSVVNDLDHLDRTWIEQRLFALEETELPQHSDNIDEMGVQVLSSHHSDSKTAGIVILGEVGYSLPIMDAAPFTTIGRTPKETEMWQMKRLQVDDRQKWTRKYLGTFTPKPTPIISPAVSHPPDPLPIASPILTSVTPKPIFVPPHILRPNVSTQDTTVSLKNRRTVRSGYVPPHLRIHFAEERNPEKAAHLFRVIHELPDR